MIITFLISTLVLWILFVNVMALKVKYEAGKIPKWVQYLLAPFVAFGYIFDVLFNVVYGSVIFWELPQFKDAKYPYLPTLSERLYDIIRGTRDPRVGSKRWLIAVFVCKNLIEPWDRNHCGLVDLGLEKK